MIVRTPESIGLTRCDRRQTQQKFSLDIIVEYVAETAKSWHNFVSQLGNANNSVIANIYFIHFL